MFKDRLKNLRVSRELLQKDVAALLGITTSAYGFYEQGKREPDIKTLMQIARFYNVSTDFLLGYDVNPSNHYSFEHSNRLIETYLDGIDAWIDNEFLSLKEKRIIKEHFAEFLSRYKELINKTVEQLMVWPEYQKSTIDFYDNQPEKLTEEQIKELYLRQSLSQLLESIERYINAFPFLLSQIETHR